MEFSITFDLIPNNTIVSINFSRQLSDIYINVYIEPATAFGVKGITENIIDKDFTREV